MPIKIKLRPTGSTPLTAQEFKDAKMTVGPFKVKDKDGNIIKTIRILDLEDLMDDYYF